MARRIVTIMAVLLACTLPRAGLAAASVFTVRDVAVDATAQGAAQARDVAIAQGQRVAFQILMHRLTRRQDWDSIPAVSDDDLPNLVLGYEVAEEHTSSTHYIAKVTYDFKPANIRDFLRRAGIGFSEARSKPELLLAVMMLPDKAVLWEDPNPWRAAWASRDLGDDLVPLVPAAGDPTDIGLVSASQAVGAKWADVSQIAQKYGLDRVLIAEARPSAGSLDVTLHELSATQDDSSQFNAAGGADEDQFNQAVDTALLRLNEDWKASTIVTYGQENTLVASIPFGSLQDWLSIRNRLSRAPTITEVDVLALSVQGAEVRLHYAGTPEQLQITLAQLSLNFSNQGSYYEISTNAPGSSQSGAPLPDLAPGQTAPAAQSSDGDAPGGSGQTGSPASSDDSAPNQAAGPNVPLLRR